MPFLKDYLRGRLIEKFGFEEVQGTKHEAVSLMIEGKKVATTRFSHGHREISDNMLSIMAREVWVQSNFFKQMITCTKSRDEYLENLRYQGKLR